MRLIKSKYVDLITFEKVLNPQTGVQEYRQTSSLPILVSVMRMKVSKAPDFQIDLARLKDCWLLYGKDLIAIDQSQVVKIGNLYYLPIASDDTRLQDPRIGYVRTVVKLGVEQGYGLKNG